ncbi:MAG TPA: glycoside hydrolase family 3 C-terminal domain-containing protein, partial [Bryobacteraceae bacterium]|nr:glycoside hydrolase family 3 C-terminal domain-containing protein [Bryobacteraceae bacterium]
DSLHVDTRYFRVEETHLPPPESYDLAICALTVRVADRKATVGLPPNETELVHALLHAGKPVIMVGLGSPYLIEGFPEASTWLASFSVQDVAERSAARALLGDIGVSGKLPVSLPGAAPHALRVGDGMSTAALPLVLEGASAELEARLKPAYELLERAAKDSQYVSGALEIAFREQRVAHGFGHTLLPREPKPHTQTESQESRIETAISSEPILVTALARLVQLKQITLDTPVSRALQGENLNSTSADWRSITIGQLLAGAAIEQLQWNPPFAAASPSSDSAAGPKTSTAQAQILSRSGAEKLIIERLTGLDEVSALRQLIYTPLGIDYFPDIVSPVIDLDRAARLRCEELSVIGQLWLNGGMYAHKRLLSRKVMEQFLTPVNRGEEIVTPGWKSAPAPGHSFTSRAFGWTSPGGTSLWVDPGREICIAYVPGYGGLTAPGNAAQVDGMRELSARIHNTIFRSLGLTE